MRRFIKKKLVKTPVELEKILKSFKIKKRA